MEEFKKIITGISPLSDESLAEFLKHCDTVKVKKDGYILKNNKVCKHIFFVKSGFIRIFYYKKGKEITEWLSSEKGFFFSITSYFKQTPSHLVIKCLEDSEIIRIDRKGFTSLISKNLEVANLFIKMLSEALILSQKRMESIQFETAKQRYKNLLKSEPEILQRVPLQHIASFLGITSETLSRIRAGK